MTSINMVGPEETFVKKYNLVILINFKHKLNILSLNVQVTFHISRNSLEIRDGENKKCLRFGDLSVDVSRKLENRRLRARILKDFLTLIKISPPFPCPRK